MATITNLHYICCLKQQKGILFWFWWPEVQCQGIDSVTLLPKALRKNLFLLLSMCGNSRYSLICGCFNPISACLVTWPYLLSLSSLLSFISALSLDSKPTQNDLILRFKYVGSYLVGNGGGSLEVQLAEIT